LEFCSDKAFLYLVKMLDDINGEYTVLYFHTRTETENRPSFRWMRSVYDSMEYRFKKNLKSLCIVHPTLWTKVRLNWNFYSKFNSFTDFQQFNDFIHFVDSNLVVHHLHGPCNKTQDAEYCGSSGTVHCDRAKSTPDPSLYLGT